MFLCYQTATCCINCETYCAGLPACYQWTIESNAVTGIATKLGSIYRHPELLPSASSRFQWDDAFLETQGLYFGRHVVESLTHYERKWLSVETVRSTSQCRLLDTHSEGDVQVLILSTERMKGV